LLVVAGDRESPASPVLVRADNCTRDPLFPVDVLFEFKASFSQMDWIFEASRGGLHENAA
jgi:hypothetical protein